jgi:hypothetical protein
VLLGVLTLVLCWDALRVWPLVRLDLARVDATWRRSIAVTAAARRAGVSDPRHVFAADWNVFPVDDPELISFYNFGFWNLLLPDFAAERPNPIRTADDPAAFAAFMREHGVRVVVLPLRDMRLRTLAAVARGERPLPGYAPAGRVTDQAVFVRVPE